MISGIGGGGYSMYTTYMGAMRGRMENPFGKIDTNGDGSLDKTEISSFADKISEMGGQSVDADELVSRLDTNEDGLISQEEFDAGRPEGPPPEGVMGMTGAMGPGGMQEGGMQGLLDMLNGLDTDSLDTNADGIVDAEEAKSGITSLIQEYLSQASSTSNQDSGKGSLLNLLG